MNTDSDVAKRERESGNKSVLRSLEKTSVAKTRLAGKLACNFTDNYVKK